jgi:hypothetical protein
MELAQNFQVVSAAKCNMKPPCVEADKPFPIMEISKQTHLEGIYIIMMKLLLNDDEQITYVLRPTYCFVVSDRYFGNEC